MGGLWVGIAAVSLFVPSAQVPTLTLDELREQQQQQQQESGPSSSMDVDDGDGFASHDADESLLVKLNDDCSNVSWLLNSTSSTGNKLRMLYVDISQGKVYREAAKKLEHLQAVAATPSQAESVQAASAAASGGHAAPSPPPAGKRRKLAEKTPSWVVSPTLRERRNRTTFFAK
eukprot:9498754-Pyramimonas_sp.AAC.2